LSVSNAGPNVRRFRLVSYDDAPQPRVPGAGRRRETPRLDRGERFAFVDVREDGEFAVDRVRGARHIGRGVLERDIETLIPDKAAPIVLYCGGGYRSALSADNLQKMGYTSVVSMDGGIRAWREAGYPIERGDNA